MPGFTQALQNRLACNLAFLLLARIKTVPNSESIIQLPGIDEVPGELCSRSDCRPDRVRQFVGALAINLPGEIENLGLEFGVRFTSAAQFGKRRLFLPTSQKQIAEIPARI